MSIRCLQLLDLTSLPNKTCMEVGHPCRKRGTKISNALLPLSLLTCSVKTLNALCNELSLYIFLALCTMLKTTHGINFTRSPFPSSLKNKERLAIEEA